MYIQIKVRLPLTQVTGVGKVDGSIDLQDEKTRNGS